MRKTALSVLAALALLAAPLPRLAAADNSIHEEEKPNFHLEVPPGWIWKPTEALQKFGAVDAAERVIEENKGWGGRVLLCVTDQPPAKELPADYEKTLMEWQLLWLKREELDPNNQSQATQQALEGYEKEMAPLLAKMVKDLTSLAGRPEILKPMMARFGAEDPKKPLTPEIESSIFINGLKEGKPIVPAIKLIVKTVVEKAPDGKEILKYPANDFLGNPAACEAHMTLFVVRRKLQRLITWIWPKVPDRPQIRDDNDTIEMLFKVVRSEAAEAKGGAGDPKGGPDPVGPPIDPKVLGDSGEDKDVTPDLNHLIVLHKPRKFKTIEIDPAKDKDLAFKYEAVDRSKSQVQFDCLVYRRDQATKPAEVPDFLASQWYQFLISNPKNALRTAPFPEIKPKLPFLSLPIVPADLSKAKEVARPPPTEKKKPVIQDIEKAGIATEEKQVVVGTEKVNASWRACMIGKSDQQGDQIFLYYGFQTVKRQYLVRVFIYKDGISVFKEELSEILASFQIFDEKDGPPKHREKPAKAKPEDKPGDKPGDKPPEKPEDKPPENPPAKPPDKSQAKPDTSDKPEKK